MKFNLGIFALTLICSTPLVGANPDLKPSNPKDYLHRDWMDTSVSPSQDFYVYANGSWLKNNPIPPEYSAWGSFKVVTENVQALIHQMIIKAAKSNAQPGSIEQKIGDFYFSGMDEATINQEGIKPLLSDFARINSIDSLTSLQKEIINLHQMGVYVLFNFSSMQDFKNSNSMIGSIDQGGLGLPNRDYYLNQDPKFQKIRELYLNHIASMLQLVGDKPEQSVLEAKKVMDIETQLAKSSMSDIEQRDPYAVYHLMDVVELDKTMPNFAWLNYLVLQKQEKIKQVNLTAPDFFKVLNKQLKEVPLDHWKSYLRWHLVNAFSQYLSQPFVDQNFKMLQALTGAEKILPRWKQVVNTENGALGFAIGQLYVDLYFPPSARNNVLDIFKNIRTALHENLSTLKWMSPETRKAALHKLDLMEERIGYPSKWWDYSSLKIDRGPYVLNIIRAYKFLIQRDLDKIGKPIDRSEWEMTPQTINAYYDPSMNNLNIPAGILQPPFFDPDAPAAVNYGAIGFVIGHEMTHGFDDEGSKFDAEGNLKNWWTPSDLKQFKIATQCIVDQFSKYVVDGNLPVQGKLVSGEATADLGGLTLAYRAFHLSKDYKNAPMIDGMTPDQQFFLAAAHIWAINMRPERMRNQVITDPHPPAQFRVNGTLVNMPEFQKAFGISENSPMVNKNRCVVW